MDLTAATRYMFDVRPKDGKKQIKVAPPAGVAANMALCVGRRFVNAMSDVADQSPANSVFRNVSGVAPAFTYNSFFIGRNTNHWIEFVVQAEVGPGFVCSGFTTSGSYPARAFDPGLKSYKPHSTALPFNLPGPNSVPFLLFSYRTQNPVDPGPFVFLG